jgi:TetR/AcrR family transcriptional regulator
LTEVQDAMGNGNATPGTRRKSRPRDAEATRGRILDAATAAFSEQGLAGARVDEIARRAGVNKALLYAYYGDKDGLFRAVLASRLAAPLAIAPAPGSDPRQALEEVIRRYFGLLLEDRAFSRLLGWSLLSADRRGREWLAEAARPFLELLDDLVRRARAAGALPDDVDPELFRTTVVGLAIGYAIQHSVMELARAKVGVHRTDDEFLDYACRVLMDGGGQAAASASRRRTR